jgi:hypothetical protein
MSKLWGVFCPKPKAAPICEIQWGDIEDRLKRIEEAGSNSTKKLNAITDALVGHMEREEAGMQAHIDLAASLDKRMAALIKLLDDSGVDLG